MMKKKMKIKKNKAEKKEVQEREVVSELVKVADALLGYIDSLPIDVVRRLPTMPGFDREWVEETIFSARSI